MIVLSILLSLAAPKAECITTDKIPYITIKSDKTHYVRLLEGEEEFCNQLASDFNNSKARRVCGCQKADYKDGKEVVRLRCAEMENGKLYSGTTAVYYYYPDSVPACIRFRDLLNYVIK